MDTVFPIRSVPLRLVTGQGHYRAVLENLPHAECSVWIATANLKDLMVPSTRPGRRGGSYVSVLQTFDSLASRGVELRILHARLPSKAFCQSFDRLPRLVRGGLELRLCPRVHLKAVVIDGTLLYLGSANWTGAGLGIRDSNKRNFEAGIVTEDPHTLDQVQAYYDSIWRGELCPPCKLRDVCESPLG